MQKQDYPYPPAGGRSSPSFIRVLENFAGFLLREFAPPAFFEIGGEAETTDGEPLQREDVVSRRGEHSPDLVVAALVQGDERFLFPDYFERRRQQRFALTVQEEGAGGEEGGLVTFEGSVQSDMINFQAMGLWMNEPVQQFAIIGQEKQAGGVLIQPTGGIETRISTGKPGRQQVIDCIARVFGAARVAIRFVQNDHERRRRIEFFPAEADLLVRRHLVFAKDAADVISDHSAADQALHFLAGAVAEIGEQFNEFHGENGKVESALVSNEDFVGFVFSNPVPGEAASVERGLVGQLAVGDENETPPAFEGGGCRF